MRLSCQKVFVLILTIIACDDSIAPRTVSALYELHTIDGRPLPTYLAATPGPTATIFSASLMLDRSGKAVMTEHRQVAPLLTEGMFINTFDYRIDGFKIEIGTFEACPINADCAPNMVGTIVGSTLKLLINPASKFPIRYEYQITNL